MQTKLIRALILEDNPEDMLILEKIIKGIKLRDVRFVAVTKLAEAVAHLKKETFDLVISDLTVPDSRGLETFHGLRAVAPKTPIILLTGMDDETMAIQAMREGAQDYLIKGEITSSLLLRAVSYSIERNTLIQERLKLITELTDSISKVKVLTGLLPICAGCKKIRNDKGYWEQVENYLKAHADIEFTHGFCPDCMERLYPEFMQGKKKQ